MLSPIASSIVSAYACTFDALLAIDRNDPIRECVALEHLGASWELHKFLWDEHPTLGAIETPALIIRADSEGGIEFTKPGRRRARLEAIGCSPN